MSRTVLVTGGNRGIGRAAAVTFAAAGYRVAATHRGGWDAGATPDVLGIGCDITDGAAVDAAFRAVEATLGPVEVLVCNAGVTADTLLLRMSEEQFTSLVDTNLTGTFRCVRRALPGMVDAGFGRIVLVSSSAAVMGAPGQANYAASKSALIGLARSLTREIGDLGPCDITANVVTPGFTRTDMTAALPQTQRDAYLKAIPAGRFAEPPEIAEAVLWLAGDRAGFIRGAVIPVDGGLAMGH